MHANDRSKKICINILHCIYICISFGIILSSGNEYDKGLSKNITEGDE